MCPLQLEDVINVSLPCTCRTRAGTLKSESINLADMPRACATINPWPMISKSVFFIKR